MSDCEALLDLMPMVAAGRVTWPADAEAHLGSCPDCQASWRIVQAGAGLGRTAAFSIDTLGLAELLSSRLASARRADRRRRGIGALGLLAAAAAIALVVWRGHPGVAGQGGSPGALTSEAQAFVIPLSGLEDLDTGELQAIYQALDAPLGAGGSAGAPALEELSPEEMSQVLATYQG